MSTPILTVNQLSIQSLERTLFQDIQFEIAAGEILAVMGPSGIGKSMLSKAIAGFTPESMSVSGDILLANVNVCNVPLIERPPEQRAAFIFQDALQALNPLVTVEAQLTLAHTRLRTKPKAGDRDTIVAY